MADILGMDMKLDRQQPLERVVADYTVALRMLFDTARRKWGNDPFLGPKVTFGDDMISVEIARG